jgi:uncharacterized protein with PIN domain
MRPLVEPLPSVRCRQCDGELRLKKIEPAHPVIGLESRTFVCAVCDGEQIYTVPRHSQTHAA